MVAGGLTSVQGEGPGAAWAVGAGLLHFDGKDWEDVPGGRFLTGPGNLQSAYRGADNRQFFGAQAVWSVAPDDVWFAVENKLYHWDGRSFSSSGSEGETRGVILALWASGPKDIWAVGRAGTLLHFTGGRWEVVASDTTDTLFAVWGSGPSDVWAVGPNGTVLAYDGVNWKRVESGLQGWLDAVWVSRDGVVWVGGSDGLLARGGRQGPFESEKKQKTLYSQICMYFQQNLCILELDWSKVSAQADNGLAADLGRRRIPRGLTHRSQSA